MSYKKTGGILTVQGLDTSKPAEYLKPENTPNVQNMRVYRDVLRKREGNTILGSNVGRTINTKLYLPMDGTDAATTFTDGSYTPHTVTPHGDVQIDTAQSVFGGASALFDGTGDYLTCANSNDWNFGSGDFNIRMRVRFNSLTGTQYLISHSFDTNSEWILYKAATTHKLTFSARFSSVTKASYVMTSNWAAVTGTWYEIEIARVGTNFYLRIDGVAQILTTVTAISTNDLGTLVGLLYIGAQSTPANYFNGWIDELILTKGDGIHNTNYTIATSAMTTEALEEYVMGGRYLLREGIGYNIRVGPSKIQKYNTLKLGWENIHDALLTAANTDPIDFATPLLTGKRILVITNYIDAIKKYEGSSLTADLGGSPPQCKFMTEHKDYLLLAYITSGGTYPTKVQWCDTSNPEEWSAGNAGNKDLNDDNEDITGMKLFGEYAAVHKNSCIYLGYEVTTSSVYQFDRKATGAGTINHATIQTLPSGDQAFLALDGIRLFNGTTAPNIGGSVTDELRESVNFSYVKRAWSIIVPELDEYWCGVPLGSSQVGDSVYKYNYKSGVVHKDLRTNAISAWRYSNSLNITWDDVATAWDSYAPRWDETSSGTNSLVPLIGDTDGVTMYRDINVNDDNGIAVDAFFETKDFEADAKGMFARFLQMEIWAKGNTITVEYSIDSGQTWAGSKTITLDSDYPSDDDPDIYYFDTASTKVRFRFRNLTIGSSFTLKQFVIGYRNRESRK